MRRYNFDFYCFKVYIIESLCNCIINLCVILGDLILVIFKFKKVLLKVFWEINYSYGWLIVYDFRIFGFRNVFKIFICGVSF